MLRHRAVQARKKGIGFVERAAGRDRSQRPARQPSPPPRQLGDRRAQHADAPAHGEGRRHPSRRALPKYAGETFEIRAAREAARSSTRPRPPSASARRCSTPPASSNYNKPDIGAAARAVLAQQRRRDRGRSIPPAAACPSWSWAISKRVAGRGARRCPTALLPWVDKGYDIVALTPSCALMLKFEWPLILPEDPAVERPVAGDLRHLPNTSSTSPRRTACRPACSRSRAASAVHLACHARAQNMGAKAAEMLRLIPETRVAVIERCSGHGGIWGARTENFDDRGEGRQARRRRPRCKNDTQPRRLGMPARRRAPGAGDGNGRGPRTGPSRFRADHPIEIFARAYGLME